MTNQQGPQNPNPKIRPIDIFSAIFGFFIIQFAKLTALTSGTAVYTKTKDISLIWKPTATAVVMIPPTVNVPEQYKLRPSRPVSEVVTFIAADENAASASENAASASYHDSYNKVKAALEQKNPELLGALNNLNAQYPDYGDGGKTNEEFAQILNSLDVVQKEVAEIVSLKKDNRDPNFRLAVYGASEALRGTEYDGLSQVLLNSVNYGSELLTNSDSLTDSMEQNSTQGSNLDEIESIASNSMNSFSIHEYSLSV